MKASNTSIARSRPHYFIESFIIPSFLAHLLRTALQYDKDDDTSPEGTQTDENFQLTIRATSSSKTKNTSTVSSTGVSMKPGSSESSQMDYSEALSKNSQSLLGLSEVAGSGANSNKDFASPPKPYPIMIQLLLKKMIVPASPFELDLRVELFEKLMNISHPGKVVSGFLFDKAVDLISRIKMYDSHEHFSTVSDVFDLFETDVMGRRSGLIANTRAKYSNIVSRGIRELYGIPEKIAGSGNNRSGRNSNTGNLHLVSPDEESKLEMLRCVIQHERSNYILYRMLVEGFFGGAYCARYGSADVRRWMSVGKMVRISYSP
jgi:hypothetical protein